MYWLDYHYCEDAAEALYIYIVKSWWLRHQGCWYSIWQCRAQSWPDTFVLVLHYRHFTRLLLRCDSSSSVRPDWQAAQVFLQRRVLRLVAPGEHRDVGVVSDEEEAEWSADAAQSGNTERWADYTVTFQTASYFISQLPKLCVKITIFMQGHVLIADWSVAHFVVIMYDVMNHNVAASAHVGARLGAFFYWTRFLENNVPFDNIPL